MHSRKPCVVDASGPSYPCPQESLPACSTTEPLFLLRENTSCCSCFKLGQHKPADRTKRAVRFKGTRSTYIVAARLRHDGAPNILRARAGGRATQAGKRRLPSRSHNPRYRQSCRRQLTSWQASRQVTGALLPCCDANEVSGMEARDGSEPSLRVPGRAPATCSSCFATTGTALSASTSALTGPVCPCQTRHGEMDEHIWRVKTCHHGQTGSGAGRRARARAVYKP